MRDDELPNFRGKVLTIYFEGRANIADGAIIEDPRLERQAGRLFLMGRVPHGVNPGDWNGGLTSAIAWDAVAEYTVFDSIDEYRKRIDRARAVEGAH
jgi:hypothetical protein